MLMMKILENDLHRSRKPSAAPFMIEVPARPEFLPALVSSTRGKFLVSRRLTDDGKIKVGVFDHDSEKVDELIPSMLTAACELSKEEKWGNVFGPRAVKTAFKYVSSHSHLPAQPHVCIAPSSWSNLKFEKTFGVKKSELKYQKYCNMVQMDIPFVVFLSKPEMVGLYTHFLNGPASILLHNVRRGMSFCV
jgi:hypothetical protein